MVNINTQLISMIAIKDHDIKKFELFYSIK